MLQEQAYERKGNVIRDMNGKAVFTGITLGAPSINAAKRESRKLQGSALGRGILRNAP